MTPAIGIGGVVVGLALIAVLLRMIRRSRITQFDIEMAKLTHGIEIQMIAIGEALLPPLRRFGQACAEISRWMQDQVER